MWETSFTICTNNLCGNFVVFFFTSNLYRTCVATYRQQLICTKLCGNFWFFSPLTSKNYIMVNLFSLHLFLFQGVRRKGLAKPTDLGEPGLKTIIKDQCLFQIFKGRRVSSHDMLTTISFIICYMISMYCIYCKTFYSIQVPSHVYINCDMKFQIVATQIHI